MNAPSSGCRRIACVSAPTRNVSTSTNEIGPRVICLASVTRRMAQKVKRRPKVSMNRKTPSAETTLSAAASRGDEPCAEEMTDTKTHTSTSLLTPATSITWA